MSFIAEDFEPKTLTEAIDLIYINLEPSEIAWLKVNDPLVLHFFVGMRLRNAWLWAPEHPLHKFFNTEYGLGHADDMSTLILTGVKAKVMGEEHDFRKQAEHFHQFWLKQNIDPLTLKEVNGG